MWLPKPPNTSPRSPGSFLGSCLAVRNRGNWLILTESPYFLHGTYLSLKPSACLFSPLPLPLDTKLSEGNDLVSLAQCCNPSTKHWTCPNYRHNQC